VILDANGNKPKEVVHIIPLDFIKAIPYKELCLINRRLAMAVLNNDAKAADKALIQLMMEIDMAGKIINLKKDGKDEEAAKLLKQQNKTSRDDF